MQFIDARAQQALLAIQRQELTQHLICARLLRHTADAANRRVLQRIADDERRHYDFWRAHTHQDVAPHRFRVWWFTLLARFFGVLFGLRLLERQEEAVEAEYARVANIVPGLEQIRAEEEEHEQELMALLQEERIDYIGSVVLGLNDALVELTGALAGFTLALQHTRLIAVVGLITGIAASLSMAASQYMSVRAEGAKAAGKNPFTAAFYTGLAYIATVVLLIAPYFVFSNVYACLAAALGIACLIIVFATFYLAVVQGGSFVRRLVEMLAVSMGVAALTFGIGWAVRQWMGIEV